MSHRLVSVKKSRSPGNTATPSDHSSVSIAVIILILAAIPFILGKYYELNTDDAFDSGLNVYTAQCMVNGQKIYQDIYPSAQTSTLLVNVIGVRLFGFSELGPKMMQMLLQLIALALTFYVLARLFGAVPAACGVLVAAFYLSCPPFAKFGNVKDQFMTASMMISAAAFILYYLTERRWLLFVSGGMAVLAYYFKPTAASVIIALFVFLIVRLISTPGHRKRYLSELIDLFYGFGFGLVPLGLMMAWQEQLNPFLQGFPAMLIIVVLFMYSLIRFLVLPVFKKVPWQKIPRKNLIIASGLAVAVVLAGVIYLITRYQADPKTRDSFFIRFPFWFFDLFSSVWRKVINMINPSSGYLARSRSVSLFQTQYNWVTTYYHFLIVPIGLGFLAVLWAIIDWCRYRIAYRRKSGGGGADISEPKVSPDGAAASKTGHFMLFLCVWWLLDMFFVWVSPRSYVQYFLPLCGSGAFLTAYAIGRCREKPSSFVVLLGFWLVMDVYVYWVRASEVYPYLVLRPLTEAGSYWFVSILSAIVFVMALISLLAFRRRRPRFCLAILAVLVFSAGVLWSLPHGKLLAENTQTVHNRRAQNLAYHWEIVGLYIRETSSPDEGLYVWGWYPGIYIQAQRFSPVPHPVYESMHIDDPNVVAGKIKYILENLKKDPPRYIVDPQKDHFPYQSHPLFDLWPNYKDESGKRQYIDADLWETIKPAMLEQVEKASFKLLTKPNRLGGAIPEDQARKLAQLERRRHEAMLPLREYVMKNYRPVTERVPQLEGPVILFERKK